MVEIDHIDYHVADSCNLACEFCTHYSNFKGSTNIVTPDVAVKDWGVWPKIIKLNKFIIIGGEPLLNPHLTEIIILAKQTWIGSRILLYSNGMLLDKHPNLRHVLDGGKFCLGLHHRNEKDDEIQNNVFRYFEGSNVEIDVINSRFHNTDWYAYYKINEDGSYSPYTDNNQRKSWESCVAGSLRCYVLKDNMLWKCPQIAFADRAGITWFNDYKPCKPTDDIAAWAKLEDESCCSNCPAGIIKVNHGIDTMKRRLPVINP